MDSFSVRKDLKGRYAVLDIGSNTLLMLIVDCRDGQLEIIDDQISIARLGEGLAKSGRISAESLGRAITIIGSYMETMKLHKADKVIAMATAAIREASNGEEIKLALEKELGAPIHILSSAQEAILSYSGTFGLHDSGTLIDIGGGSTEIASYENQSLSLNSIPIGAVKIKEMFLHSDPPKQKEVDEARSHIQKCFSDYGIAKKVTNIQAVAGTPVTIASIDLGLPGYDAEKIHGHSITQSRLAELVDMITAKNAEELRERLHVHPHRSDIIGAGALILEEFVKFTDSNEINVNCLGLRFGPLAVSDKIASKYNLPTFQ